MPRPAADIESVSRGTVIALQPVLDPCQIRAGGMHAAGKIALRAEIELRVNGLIVRGHADSPAMYSGRDSVIVILL
jgi:hypothetical protein